MKNLKTITAFVLGIFVGGLIFGLMGPVSSQAGSVYTLPGDLFQLVANIEGMEGGTPPRQVFAIQDKYPNYTIKEVARLSSHKKFMVYVTKTK